MKKILVCLLLLFGSAQLYAQTNSQTERGIELFHSERYDEALTCFQTAAKAGDASAQTWLGYMYQYGEGVTKNPQIAINMYNKAIAQNYPIAMRYFGDMYRDGDGIGKDPDKAFALYKKAADLNDSHSLLRVSQCYYSGIGVVIDTVKSFEYCLQAAEAGNEYSYEQLAFHYLGNGTEQNLENAAKYFELTAENRSDYGTYLLAQIYFHGSENLLDPIKSEELLHGIKDNDSSYAELYVQVKEAADKARYRLKMEKLYADAWSGCKRYTFASDGNSNDSPSGVGKSYVFNNKSLSVGNHFYHNDIFGVTFWIKGSELSGPVLNTIKSNAPKPNVFPSVEISGGYLTFIPGPYADVQTPFNYPVSSLQDGKWHMIALTFGRNVKKMYVDGKLVGNMTANTAQISQGDVIYLGGGQMQLANVRLYKANILSLDEVQAIYMMEGEGK